MKFEISDKRSYWMRGVVTLRLSGITSPNTIHIMQPAANPTQMGRNWLNISAQRKAGTATRGWGYGEGGKGGSEYVVGWGWGGGWGWGWRIGAGFATVG